MELCGSKQDYVGISRLLRDRIIKDVCFVCGFDMRFIYGSILDSYGIYIGFIRDVYWNHIGLLYGLIDRQVTWDSEGPWSHIPPKKNDLFNTVSLVLAVVK